jgi:hypothetical protein
VRSVKPRSACRRSRPGDDRARDSGGPAATVAPATIGVVVGVRLTRLRLCPTIDIDETARRYVNDLGATLEWRVRALGTTVAALRVADSGPLILLSGHLEGERPILVYRIADYQATVAALRPAVEDLVELEIPHGPCAAFRAPGGQRFAIYELTRPEADEHFAGRFDP